MEKKTARGKVVQLGLALLLVLLVWGAALPTAAHPVYALAPTPPDPATGPKIVRFSGTSIQHTVPPGTIPQIDLRLSGADYPGCIDQPESPQVDFKTDDLELTDIAIIATCGWKANETVKVTLLDPSGKTLSTEMRAVPTLYGEDVYQVIVFFQPGVDAPEGKYRFTLQGSATVNAKVVFSRAKEARLYAASNSPFQPQFGAVGAQQRLRLQGFLPDEPIRLLAYKYQGTQIKFYGWQDYTADSSGRLLIETDIPDAGKDTEWNYYAYGRGMHFVPFERFTRDGFRITHQFDMELYCPGAQEPRLSGAQAVRAVTGITKLDIHQQPGYGSYISAQVPAETPMRLFGYPKCIDHAFWWKVSLSKPVLFGWIAESYLGKYIIEPLP